MRQYFICRIDWMSGTKSTWVEIVDSDLDPKEATLLLASRIRAQHPIHMGKLIVTPSTENEASLIPDKPVFYKPAIGRRACKC